jgi:hypothetical protein
MINPKSKFFAHFWFGKAFVLKLLGFGGGGGI